MTLADVLRCDKKTLFLLAHLSQLRRHSVLHCYSLLKHRPEDDVEGGTGAIEVSRVSGGCVLVALSSACMDLVLFGGDVMCYN